MHSRAQLTVFLVVFGVSVLGVARVVFLRTTGLVVAGEGDAQEGKAPGSPASEDPPAVKPQAPGKKPVARKKPVEDDAPLRQVPKPAGEPTSKDDQPGSGDQKSRIDNTVLREREFPPIVAIVEQRPISRKQFLAEYQRRLEEYSAVLSSRVEPMNKSFVVREVLGDLVHNELLVQAALRKAGGRELNEIVTSERALAEVDRRVEDLKKRGYSEFSSREDYFASQLKRFGQKREQVLADLRKRVLVNTYLWEEVFRDLDRFISPSESRSYYHSNLEEFTTPLGYSYRRISFQDGFNTSERVKKVQEALADGEPFVDVARKYSEEFSNEKLRGRQWDKTYEEVKGMPYPFPQIIQGMKPGEVSPPRKVQGAVVFVRLESVRTGDPLSYPEAQPRIERLLLTRRHEARTRVLVDRLRRYARVESYIPGIVLEKVESSEVSSAPQGGGQGGEQVGRQGDVGADRNGDTPTDTERR